MLKGDKSVLATMSKQITIIITYLFICWKVAKLPQTMKIKIIILVLKNNYREPVIATVSMIHYTVLNKHTSDMS